MKRLLFIVTMLAACININAETQCDVILTTKNFQIPCTIIKIGEMEVQYKECPSTIDKLVIVSIKDIRKIYLSDGTIMDYPQSTTPDATKVEQRANDESLSPTKPKVENVGEQIRLLSSPTPPQQQEKRQVSRQEQSTIEKSVEGTNHVQNNLQNEAYDVILTTDANKIEAKITEVSKSEIKYKEKDNIDGPTFVLETTDIHSILYANGKVVLYNQQTSSQADNTKQVTYSMQTKEENRNCVCYQTQKSSGDIYTNWNKWLDYINIVKRIDIYRYRTIYLFPIDNSQIKWPEESDNQYPALVEEIKNFPFIIKEAIQSEYRHLNVIIVNESEGIQMDETSLGLCLRFDELDMGNRALRFWVGFGAGAQNITISGMLIDGNSKELFDFRHRRVTVAGRRKYNVSLQKEFKNFAEDICRIFGNIQ